MKESPNRNYVVEIPVHWTPEQADAVFEFIAIIETAIWDNYGDNIMELDQLQKLAEQIDENRYEEEDDEDSLPF